MILGYDDHRITKLREHFKTSPRELQLALDRLIRVSDAADGQYLWLPSLRGEFLSQQLRRVFFHQNLRFKVEARRKAKVLVIRPGITVDATVLATAIRIDARFKPNIGTVVVSDQRL